MTNLKFPPSLPGGSVATSVTVYFSVYRHLLGPAQHFRSSKSGEEFISDVKTKIKATDMLNQADYGFVRQSEDEFKQLVPRYRSQYSRFLSVGIISLLLCVVSWKMMRLDINVSNEDVSLEAWAPLDKQARNDFVLATKESYPSDVVADMNVSDAFDNGSFPYLNNHLCTVFSRSLQ